MGIRSLRPVRQLTVLELGLEEKRSIERPPVEVDIPEQIDAPIITDVVDHRLTKVSGRSIELDESKSSLSDYLADQYMKVSKFLEESNASKVVVIVFRDAIPLLRD
jgi:hypothetical protein